MTLEEIERLLASDYGIQALNTHHVRWLVEEVVKLRDSLKGCSKAYFALEVKHALDSSSLKDVRRERAELRRRLAELSCELCGGHGMLGSPGATDSARHGECCPDCAGSGINPAMIAKIKAAAVREAREVSVLAHEHGNNPDYSKGFDDAIAQYDAHMEKFAAYLEANQIGGGE